MKYNGTTVPNYRDDTYNKDEVHRKSADELYDTAFNEDQQKVLDEFEPSGGGSLPDVTTEDNGDILTVVDGEWAKAEPGYKCSETSTTLTEENVTTSGTAPYISGNFSYSTLIDADTITVTFNGTEYEASKIVFGSSNVYGGFTQSGPDFSEYPFSIMSALQGSAAVNMLFTESAGTYSVKIEVASETVETSECFDKAVKKSGLQNIADRNNYSIVENYVESNVASGSYSHAEGYGTTASGNGSHAEGAGTTANGNSSHAEGASTTASGSDSHAEGHKTTASGNYSHAEGYETKANNPYSHAEGYKTTTSGEASHAEGTGTTASGAFSHAQNEYTIAQGKDQTAIGKYNIAQGTNASIATTDYAFIIGNGTSQSNRSNAFAIKWDGTFVFANGTEITPTQFTQILALLN